MLYKQGSQAKVLAILGFGPHLLESNNTLAVDITRLRAALHRTCDMPQRGYSIIDVWLLPA